MTTRESLNRMYETLERAFGPQRWWPGETPFEMMVGAVLTQNTNWRNVEKAIANLKREDALDPRKLDAIPLARLAELIRPAGYYNIKSKRLRNLVRWFVSEFDGDVAAMSRLSVGDLRERLLSVSGVGRETCDCIILYALHKPTFVVDAYTFRILLRHGLVDESADYDEIKETFESNLPSDAQLFNEFHALLVRAGKLYCRKVPLCDQCPLDELFADRSRRPAEFAAGDE